jgi:homoserine kinase type II
VENSNFLLTTERASYILTLYEKRVRREDLPFFIGLMEHLAARSIACPTPVKARNGEALGELCNRPAAIVTFLDGMWPRRPTARHCQLLGTALAQMHLAGADFVRRRPNDLSVAGWRRLHEATKDRADEVSAGLADEIRREIEGFEASWPQDLPSGVIHADLFPDNVFYLGDRLSGVIDFYFACNDAYAYDIAVCLNAWCFEHDGSFNVTKARLFLAAYVKTRPVSKAELDALPMLARGSALRFLLTRLYDWLNHPPGAFVKPKDPLEYLAKLRFHAGLRGPGGYGLEP